MGGHVRTQFMIDGRLLRPRTGVVTQPQPDKPVIASRSERTSSTADAAAGADAVTAPQATRARAAHSPKPVGPSTSRRPLRETAHEGHRDREIDKLEHNIKDLERKQATMARLSHMSVSRGTTNAAAQSAAQASAIRTDIAEQKEELQEQKVLNLLTDVVHSLGAPQSVVNALDGGVEIEVVDERDLASDAAYNTTTRRVEVSDDLIEDAEAALSALQAQGIVDEDGSVIDSDRLDASSHADSLIKTATLVGVHEVLHARQDTTGILARSDERRRKLIQTRMADAQDLDPALRRAVYTDAERDAEMQRIRIEEVPAYRTQEQADLALGASVRVLVTVDRTGNPLPLEQAAENVYALQMGTPLLHGESAGWSRSAYEQQQQAASDSVPGFRRPGEEIPGFRRPGETVPGFRRPGETVPGFRRPGETVPGFRRPGETVPGFRRPGYGTD